MSILLQYKKCQKLMLVTIEGFHSIAGQAKVAVQNFADTFVRIKV